MAPEAGGEDPEKVPQVPRGVRQEVQPLTNTGRRELALETAGTDSAASYAISLAPETIR